MAHTDKDRPLWVAYNDRANRVGERHRCRRRRLPCDIDVTLSPSRKWNLCSYELTDRNNVTARYNHWWDRPDHAERREGYWKPERAAVRFSMRKLTRAARAGSDLDDSDAPASQHRRSPFGGGYWE